jgi:hypothetical protein
MDGPGVQEPPGVLVDRSTASATSPLREEVFVQADNSGYMSDDSGARALSRGASRKLNKTLRQLNPFKVPGGEDVCLYAVPSILMLERNS